jgi:hypothetical protein
VFDNSSVLACIMLETDSKSCAQRTLQVGWEDTTVMTQPTHGLPRNAMHFLGLNRGQHKHQGQGWE